MSQLLVTGGAGFIGSHVCEHILKTTDDKIVVLDRLDETASLARIGETDAYRDHRDRLRFVWHDLRSPINAMVAHQIGHVDAVIHLAASTHVDRSIVDPMSFVQDNVVGTVNVLDYVRRVAPSALFYYQSTDEVFGPALPGTCFDADDAYHSSNPYAASKAAAEEFVVAYANTYRVKTIIAHAVNVIGERQNAEKFLPLLIRKLLLREQILIHADTTRTIATSRFYVHARNVAAAILFLLDKPAFGGKYNIVDDATEEVDSATLAKRVAAIVGVRPNYVLIDAVSNRPGHDMRYELKPGLLTRSWGFKFPIDFNTSLERTVRWYVAHPKWLGL